MFLERWRCELSGDIVSGGQWHERYAALGDLPHFTRVDEHQQQTLAAATASPDSQFDEASDGLEEISIS